MNRKTKQLIFVFLLMTSAIFAQNKGKPAIDTEIIPNKTGSTHSVDDFIAPTQGDNVIPSSPKSCTHILNLYDSFGDGWNGNTISIAVNSQIILNHITFVNGNSESFDFSAETGDVITLDFWADGMWQEECSWDIVDGMGETILTGDASAGNPVNQTIDANCDPPVAYLVTFMVSSAMNSEPIEGAEISIHDTVLTTNSDGIATIHLIDGDYPYIIEIENYSNYTGILTVAGSPITEAIEILPITYTVEFGSLAGIGSVTATVDGITISSGDTVAAGSDILFEAVLENGHYIIDWWLNGNSTGITSTSVTYSNLDMDIEVYAEILDSPVFYTVEYGIYGEEGGTVEATVNGTPITSGDMVAAGSDVTFEVNLDPDYEIAQWRFNGSPTSCNHNPVVYENLDMDILIEAELEMGVKNLITPELSVYPNPSNGFITIEAKGIYEVNGLNSNGKVIYTGKIVDDGIIDLTEQAAGIYILQLKSDQRMVTRKIVIK